VFVCVCVCVCVGVGVGGLQLLIAELKTNHSPFLRTLDMEIAMGMHSDS
jgi:hypothetical protein